MKLMTKNFDTRVITTLRDCKDEKITPEYMAGFFDAISDIYGEDAREEFEQTGSVYREYRSYWIEK